MSERDAHSEQSTPTPTPVALGILPTSRSLCAAFAGPSWSGAASFESLGVDISLDANVLSDTGALVEASAPVVFHAGTGTAVAHVSPRGVEVTRLDRDRSQLAFGGATVFAVAPGRRQSRLFAIDPRGVSSVRYEAKKGCSEDERWLEHAGHKPFVAAARAGDAEIAFVAWAGEPALYVIVQLDGKPRVVRHELASDCVGLAAAGAGNRAGVAVALAGTDHVEVAIADVRGVLVERMHTCLEGRGARWRHPQVLWIEDAFHVLAVDESEQRTVIATFDGDIRGDVTGAGGRFATAYYEKALYIARAAIDEGTSQVAVQGYRMSLTQNSATRPFTLTLAPPRALWRARAQERAEQTIRATHDALDTGARGYRGGMSAAPAASLVADDACVVRIEPMHASIGAVMLGVSPCDAPHAGDAVGYDVTLLALAQGASDEPQPEGSLERLARWVNERVSKAAWELAVREQAWIDRVADDLGGRGFWDRDANGLRLIVHLERAPNPELLAPWCKRVLLELAERTWERNAGAS